MGDTERMTTTMTTRTATRAASAAALTLSAMLALSACGGGDDDTAQAEGVGDNSQAQGVYINHSENRSNLLVIHGKDIATMGYRGETCEDFRAFFDAAESGDFSAVKDDDGDEDDDIANIPDPGTLNDTQSQILYPTDTGEDPKPVSVNSPDTGYITVGNDGEYFVPKDSEEGKAIFDVWENAQCG